MFFSRNVLRRYTDSQYKLTLGFNLIKVSLGHLKVVPKYIKQRWTRRKSWEPITTLEWPSTITEELAKRDSNGVQWQSAGVTDATWQTPGPQVVRCHQETLCWEEQNRELPLGYWGGTSAQRGTLRSEPCRVVWWGCFPYPCRISTLCPGTIVSLRVTWYRGPGSLGVPFYRCINANQGLYPHDLISQRHHIMGEHFNIWVLEGMDILPTERSTCQQRWQSVPSSWEHTQISPNEPCWNERALCLQSGPSLGPFPIHTQLSRTLWHNSAHHDSLLWCCCWGLCYFRQFPGTI